MKPLRRFGSGPVHYGLDVSRLPVLALPLSLGLLLAGRSPALADDSNLGVLDREVVQLSRDGKYEQAVRAEEELLATRKRSLGPEHVDTARSLDKLAELYVKMGDYAKAEPLCQEALQIYQKTLGPDRAETAGSLNNLAFVYDAMGAYEKAEPLYLQALQICQKTLGPDNPYTARTLNRLALLYDTLGDYGKAEPLYREALRIDNKTLPPDHPDIALSLNNLALLYFHMGTYERAQPLYQRALQIRKKAFGPDDPYTAVSLNNLAELYRTVGAYTLAEPLYQQALRINKKAFGLYHPDTAVYLNNLGALYAQMGAYELARPLLENALRINEKAFGADHPRVATTLESLARLKFDLGQVQEAKAFAQQSTGARLGMFAKVLDFTSEQQRLAYQETLQPYSCLAALTGSDAQLASTVLHCKGVVLDSLIEDRLMAEASKTSEERALLARLSADKLQLERLLLQSPNLPSGETDTKIEALEHEVEQIEGRLAGHVAGLRRVRWALSVTVGQVQAAIPNDGALIEYLRYEQYLGKGEVEPRYGAVVLTSSGQPRWIALGSAKDVDAVANRYQALVRGAPDPGELSESLETLYGHLWGPIERSLPPEVKRVILSPDGLLNFVSFATLLDADEHFLAEKYAVQYVASGRDLLREVKRSTTREVVLFANPDFGLTSTAMLAKAENRSSDPGSIRGSEKRDVEDWSFKSLEGTQKERDELIKEFVGWGWTLTDFTRKEATKEALLKIHSPYILHLATHGFFAREDPSAAQTESQASLNDQQSVTKSKFFKNPMHRSGLALAGAQTTIEAWKREEVPPVENDGILTAEDVSTLDLQRTWLVTLSACDTGSGQARAGEGVMGLRRGFIQAGAQNLLMTLWPISDEVTVQIMSDFYEAAHKTGNAPEALDDVQRKWLVKLRAEKGLAQAVNLAGPFIMSSQGKP